LNIENNGKDHGGTPVEIKPISFRPPGDPKKKASSKVLKWFLSLVLGSFLTLLCASAWFVFTSRQVVVRVEPTPERMDIIGGLITPKIGDYHLMQPGKYIIEAEKECFQPLQEKFAVAKDRRQNFKFSMTRLPGILSIEAYRFGHPTALVADALIEIEGRQQGRTPLSGLQVEPGRRMITVRAENYQVLNTEIEVAGCGERQQFNLALVPGWADITLQSLPAQAAVSVDGKVVGKTPLTFRLLEGDHELLVRADRFKPWRTRLAVVANQPQELGIIQLQPADGKLAVRTQPAGANVMIGNTFAGQTPLSLTLPAEKPHLLQVSKAGYKKAKRTVKLLSEESKTLSITLKPEMGVIDFVVQPADADLFINGKPAGRVPATLRLVAVEHQLEIRRQGYRPYQTRITPRPGFKQEISVALTKLSSGPQITAGIIKAANGYVLKLVQPGPFSMGSSRREQGRRSNETLRKIKLQRPFFMGIREVTNKEVRQFLKTHNSGAFKGQSLNPDPLPAVDITWEQAALFCNWLSVKDSLRPVYVRKGGRMTAVEPVGNGYRLPTEAEWEYCARFNGSRAALKYPWGTGYPPSTGAGNFADASAKDIMANYLASYNDRYAVSAPPSKYKPNALGLFDMGGNVSEWCHDYYSIYPYKAGKLYVDPMGPQEGAYHVIKGASWMQSGISELRLAYRDYSDTKRPDLGFRIARYVK